MFIKNFYNFTLDIFFPKFCLGCGREGSFVCDECFSLIPVLKNTNCFICGRRSPDGRVCQKCKHKFYPALAGLLVCSDWDNLLLRQMIYDFKYNFVSELSVPLSRLMINFLETYNLKNLQSKELIFISVPLHVRRLVWRGFNQAEILTKKIASHFGLEINNKIIKRNLHTPPQMEIKDEKSRQKNIANAFSLLPQSNVKKDFYRDKIFIIVDDVSTTTATIKECARTLKKLKPKEIWGLVLARG